MGDFELATAPLGSGLTMQDLTNLDFQSIADNVEQTASSQGLSYISVSRKKILHEH